MAFLTDRSFRVIANGALSTAAKTTTGCPQGTVLGVLAYVLYTNSIKDIFKEQVFHKAYAVDTKVYARVNDEQEHRALQRAIDDFHSLTKSLDLSLPDGKWLVMYCGRKNDRRPSMARK